MNNNSHFTITLKLAVAMWLITGSATSAQTAVQAWVQRYSNLISSDDWAEKVIADNAGNVIVAGYTDGGISGSDMVVLKYSGAGVPLWTNRYNGPGNSNDFAVSVAVDGSGNVYVTGGSWNGANYDYATIKYVSVPVVRTLQHDGSGGFLIYVQGMANVAYRLQRAPSVTGPWITSAPQTAPASGLVMFHDLFPPPGQAFYRSVQP